MSEHPEHRSTGRALEARKTGKIPVALPLSWSNYRLKSSFVLIKFLYAVTGIKRIFAIFRGREITTLSSPIAEHSGVTVRQCLA